MKVSKSDVNVRVSSPSMSIRSYPLDLKNLSIARIRVKGRHPYEEGAYFIEHKCDVLFYIIKGKGKVVVGGESYVVCAKDVITIPSGAKYYIEGDLDYIAACSPAYFREQNEIVNNGKQL